MAELVQMAKGSTSRAPPGCASRRSIFALLQAHAAQDQAGLRRGRARVPARRLRLPPGAGLQLPAGSGRHLRLAVADPALQPAHRRQRERLHPPAQGARGVLRAAQGRQDQRRAPRGRPRQDPLRQPHAALPAAEVQHRERDRRASRRASSTCSAPSGRAALPHRLAAPRRQDGAAPAARQRDLREPPGHRRSSCCSSTSARKR